MDSYKNNKVKREESIVPERRGTEFLLEPPDQRSLFKNSTHKLISKLPPTQNQRITRARPERYLIVAPQCQVNIQPRKLETMDKRTKPGQFVDKYISSFTHPLIKSKPRKTFIEKTGLKPIIPTDDAQRKQGTLRYPKSIDQSEQLHSQYYNAWAEPNTSTYRTQFLQNQIIVNPTDPLVHGKNYVHGIPAKYMTNPVDDRTFPYLEISEGVRPKTPGTPGRRQNDEEEGEEKTHELNMVQGHGNCQQLDMADFSLPEEIKDVYCHLNKNPISILAISVESPLEINPVTYMFSIGQDNKNGSPHDKAYVDSFNGPAGVKNICLADLARNASRIKYVGAQKDRYEGSYGTEGKNGNYLDIKPSTEFDSDDNFDSKPPEKTFTSGKESVRGEKSLEKMEYGYPDVICSMTYPREKALNHINYKDEGLDPLFWDKKMGEICHSNFMTDKSTLKVNNLNDNMGYNKMMNLFPKATAVTYPVYDLTGPATLKPTRYCYVMFDEAEVAAQAFEQMDGFVVKGTTLNIEYRHYIS